MNIGNSASIRKPENDTIPSTLIFSLSFIPSFTVIPSLYSFLFPLSLSLSLYTHLHYFCSGGLKEEWECRRGKSEGFDKVPLFGRWEKLEGGGGQTPLDLPKSFCKEVG